VNTCLTPVQKQRCFIEQEALSLIAQYWLVTGTYSSVILQ